MSGDKKKKGFYRKKKLGTKKELGFMPLNEFRTNILEARKHPVFIFGQIGKEYIFFVITHKEITSGTRNIKLIKNPNPDDKEISYFRPKPKRQHKSTFSKTRRTWTINEQDLDNIKQYMKIPESK